MTKTDILIVEVSYAALPREEMDERSAQLRSLLLRGAMRSLRLNSARGERKGDDTMLVESGQE